MLAESFFTKRFFTKRFFPWCLMGTTGKKRLVGKLCARMEISRDKRFSKALQFQVESELQGSTAAEHPSINAEGVRLE